ncbi:MAG: hypothetical protein UU95_C0011G0012 [Parcubacteria group bacterium GW2011_GWC2_42_12]|uniref:Uncharacterized protein n=1 Tax=Candidatus Falkowbacteria bacterium RIFCSPHIGHO2_02_FULL_42_9 TaxID=1797986 RepID=A0A1F5S9D1_9BACT|nr:MAG: hypothetical protein UU95_C0011G0012 [Parcubacteria group bacterium GW2011_GWC2_42_12]OGF23320.1 MAG: hypothetical protein A3D45_01715 [Candidatus Falkowbacteria bacterium RIFCSPHIGHO2_02_FULL_42_9]
MSRAGTTNDFDSNLLLDRDQEGEAAGELREKKSAKNWKDLSFLDAGQGFDQSFREQLTAARRIMVTRMKRALAKKTLAPAKQGLSYLLKAAWLNLIDSFGLTLIWINIHVFLRWSVSDKLFCALGEEWLPKQVTAAGGDAAKTAGKGFGLLEIVVLLILDLIILFVIIAVLALIVMIVDFMQASWYEKIYLFIGGLTKLGWSGISALYNLF